MSVLVPGAGLCRLAWEIASLGFQTEANEFAYHMLLASNWILNVCHETTILHPFVHSFNHLRTNEAQLKGISIPDTFASTLQNPNFSMAAGDFTEIYNDSQFSVVVTCFFLDTARDVTLYLRIIFDALHPGGRWINFGPCLWHFGLEMSLEEVVKLVERVGFVIEHFSERDCGYIEGESLWKSSFGCGFWVARRPDQAG